MTSSWAQIFLKKLQILIISISSALAMMPDVKKELPYEGAKAMLLVDNVDDRAFL